MKFGVPGMDLTAEVRDNQRPVHEVVRGRGYGHVLLTSEYHGFVNTVLTVSSNLQDTQQLEFKSGAAWICKLPLEPNDPSVEKRELLACCKKHVRRQDEIRVFVHDASAVEQPTPNPQKELLTIL
jgi:hypothetical protein